ncbi:MAG: pre-peptidase C-terminal domain-containing protein [Flavobacteriales bacterium]|nr:pre-peptidase C-terminal domain-containing protein [Flavobacteriales bacterium]
MRSLRTPLFSFILLLRMSSVTAQWTDVVNNNINFEFRSDQTSFTGSDDGFPTYDAEPTVRNDFWVSSLGWYGWVCSNWSTSSVPYQGDPSGTYFWGTNHPFTAEFQITLQAWESDNSDPCSYTSGDDDFWNGNAILRDGNIQMPIVYPSTDFRPCTWNPWLASGTGWIFPNAGVWNQIWAETWRYSAGDVASDPLSFGTITAGQTKADINANRSVPVSSSAPLQYGDSYGESSADVWYSFTLDQAATVTISTDDPVTDFDTKAYLFYDFGNMIASDDDGGTGATSLISTALCAGTYKVCVEGFSSSTGLFRLSVTAGPLDALSLATTNITPVSCAGATDGAASWSTGGGVAPFEYVLDGNNIGGATSGGSLGLGAHTVMAEDACGSTTSITFQVDNGDSTPPMAVCLGALAVDVVDQQTTMLDPAEVDNGSTDDCGPVSLSVSPTGFDVNDVGLVDVTLTVTDGNGNTSTCICVAVVQNVTAIGESGSDGRILAVPNPTDGQVRLDLSALAVGSDTRLELLDALGRSVQGVRAVSSIMDLDLGQLADGVYTVRLIDPNWRSSTRLVLRR